jgi:arabinose-5-phosphate isomerase
MVLQDSKVGKAIEEINAKKLGATLVVNKNKRLVGIVTDGDLRRALTTHKNIHAIDIKDIMSPSAKTINENQTAAQALELMELNAITHLVILDKKKRIKGLVHLHDLLGREEFKANGSINPTTGAYR